MKREIKILIETDTALAEEGFVRVAVTEMDDTYRLHSLSQLHTADQPGEEISLSWIIGQQVYHYLELGAPKVVEL